MQVGRDSAQPPEQAGQQHDGPMSAGAHLVRWDPQNGNRFFDRELLDLAQDEGGSIHVIEPLEQPANRFRQVGPLKKPV